MGSSAGSASADAAIGAAARTQRGARARPAKRPARRSLAQRAGGGGRPARVALVTGAARGIGAATVRMLAERGWSVVAVDRDGDDPRLPYALGRLTPPAGVVGHLADVTDAEALGAAVALAEERFGGLDAMIAAAGVIAGGVPQWKVPLEQEQAVLDVDLGGVLNAARVGIPALLRRPEPREGRFIAVASTAAVRGLPMLAAYCAAKAGVTGLVRALAVELGGTGVTANAVSPGSTRTPILEQTARLYDLDSGESFARQQPLGRLLEPDEVAALIVWLAGVESRGATGGVLPVDGGLAL